MMLLNGERIQTTKNDTSMDSNISFKSLSRSSSRDYHPIITGNSDDESFSDEEEEENSIQ